MAIYKIIVTGSFNSGKTEFIKCISEIDPITTDKPVTEEGLKDIKNFTTVAIDFGVITIDKEIIIHIYATPGQERFKFIYDILEKNALALIVLGDITNKESISNMYKYYREFMKIKRLPAVFALTKKDLPNRIEDRTIEQLLSNKPKEIPLIKISNKEVIDFLISYPEDKRQEIFSSIVEFGVKSLKSFLTENYGRIIDDHFKYGIQSLQYKIAEKVQELDTKVFQDFIEKARKNVIEEFN
ncbi:ATP/GTP-binding protein, partial [Desulfurella sp.]|uniref:GTP-binding protein n=1 Tax=Desulfurella sp. TaxID=1962857 RepID=UPI0025BC4570